MNVTIQQSTFFVLLVLMCNLTRTAQIEEQDLPTYRLAVCAAATGITYISVRCIHKLAQLREHSAEFLDELKAQNGKIMLPDNQSKLAYERILHKEERKNACLETSILLGILPTLVTSAVSVVTALESIYYSTHG